MTQSTSTDEQSNKCQKDKLERTRNDTSYHRDIRVSTVVVEIGKTEREGLPNRTKSDIFYRR